MGGQRLSATNEDEAVRQEMEKRLMRERVLRVVLTSEARARLNNIKMVKPQLAKLIEDQIIQQASAGRITRPITDDELKQILASIQQPKKEFRIRWA